MPTWGLKSDILLFTFSFKKLTSYLENPDLILSFTFFTFTITYDIKSSYGLPVIPPLWFCLVKFIVIVVIAIIGYIINLKLRVCIHIQGIQIPSLFYLQFAGCFYILLIKI